MSKFLDSITDREIIVEESAEFRDSISNVPSDNLKICLICSRPFIKSNAKYCNRKHYTTCLVCGNKIAITSSHINGVVPKTCSKSCADLIGVKTYKENCIQKYGVSNPMLVPELAKQMVVSRNPEFDFSLKEEQQHRKCEVCGTDFIFDYLHPRKCCSKECSAKLRKLSIASNVRICKLCGKHFKPTSNTSSYCEGPHYRNCVICGKEFVLNVPDSQKQTCSDECRFKLYQKTCMDKYGVDIGSKSKQAREKLSIAGKINNPKQIKESVARPPVVKLCKICNKPFQIENNAQTICNSNHYRNCDVCGKAYLYSRPWTQLCCSSECTMHKRTSNKHIVSCDGLPLDSSYEKIVYDFWHSLGLTVKRNIPIKFEYNGKLHTTFIDFEVEGILYEVKGMQLLQGTYDYKQAVPISKKLEIYKQNHVVIITDSTENICDIFGKPNSKSSNGLKYLNKCPEPLIGIDISLFKDNPKFPYSPERPKCFYDVKVGGKLSAHEAFYDPEIRWKMILNRIMYVGGFIDNKQVLTAMNVTRMCKQPSWFSTSFAKEIITKYCTSDVIVDPFAGWGARHDATISLGKRYIGVDMNAELVSWHKSLHRSIELGDASLFKYSDKCSVFICPPYQDVEVYFDGQNCKLTQCEWLNLVMNNIPNANEYVMVCKIVDPGWEKYIVDIKENKSHFGTNKEYVLVVPNL